MTRDSLKLYLIFPYRFKEKHQKAQWIIKERSKGEQIVIKCSLAGTLPIRDKCCAFGVAEEKVDTVVLD